MISIISGTNRSHSNTQLLSKIYQQQLELKGLKSNIISLTDLPEDLLQSDLYGQKDSFKALQEQVNLSDKFIFIIPEYNGSFPGALKLFIDYCDYPGSFKGKKAALVGCSSGKYGNVRGVDHFSGVCSYLNLHVLPLRIHITYIRSEFDEQKQLYKEDTLRFVDQQIEEFIRF